MNLTEFLEDNRLILLIILLAVLVLSATGVLDWSRIWDTVTGWFGQSSGSLNNSSSAGTCYTPCGTKTCG